MISGALTHPKIWFRCYKRALIRPVKWAAISISVLASLLIVRSAYLVNRTSATVEPILSQLEGLSSQSSLRSGEGRSGSYWFGTYHPKDASMDQKSFDLIIRSLQKAGWHTEHRFESSGGKVRFLIQAEKWNFRLIAQLPKFGAPLRVDVAKKHRPEVAWRDKDAEITRR